ncbi:metallophosphoesterase [Streptomyces sp. J2-1]|uniref:metallophosphoesterase family protein n=1 Tax=Streptomyces corallincola TaxID=2851888 RepID=UPI001C395676|nr:metallophosphoesterase [Streptomyces corallincola]MBV2356232.1 metallophosphoesterase [Streptomyces corallincola]
MSDSSRDTAQGAGWGSPEPGSYKRLMPDHVEKLSWLNPKTLLAARNGVLASWFGDPTGHTRSVLTRRQAEAGAPADKLMRRVVPERFSFMVIGDTGEGDEPQYAVVPGFLKISEGTEFAVVASDVIYPVGAAADYGTKFFRPYQDYPAPIYAIPGNHDWYEDLGAFMRVFGNEAAVPPGPAPRARPFSRAWLRDLLWHRPKPVDEQRLAQARTLRSAPGQRAVQPGPYWALDAGPVRIVGIDTGLLGTLDAEQGAWLREISRGPKPKILITGSPLYVDGEYHPCPIDGGGTVDDIVRDPDHHYVAAIGGDIHNYQRYPVDVDGRTVQYVVAGGGGAFMHATHTIPRVSVGGVTEREFRCYPLRGDSLAFYSRLYGRRLRLRRFFTLSASEATAVVAERLGVEPARTPDPDARVTRRSRTVATLLGTGSRPERPSRFRLPVRKTYTQLFSPGSATYSPPFFKSFLRLDVGPDAVRLRCHAATGNLAAELDPPVEDEVVIPLNGGRSGAEDGGGAASGADSGTGVGGAAGGGVVGDGVEAPQAN